LGPQPSLKNIGDPGHALLAQGKAWPGLFAFSTKECELVDAGQLVRLSVWEVSRTSTKQAWVLIGMNDNNRVLLRLSVDAIQTVALPASVKNPAILSLDVVWETATQADPVDPAKRIPNTQPGANGHCGIDGLYRGDRAQQKKLRQLLADTVRPGDLAVLTDEQIASFQAAATSA